MAIGFVPGAALLANLDRLGANLSFTTSSTTLAYLDFTNFRLGINTATPTHALDVTGNINATGTVILAGNLAVNSGNLTTTASTVNLLNATAATMNFAGAATIANIGAATGTVTLNNANVWYPNATTLNGAQTTVALLNVNATTINAFGATTALTIGATTGTANIRNANLYLPNATTIYSGQASLEIANVNVTTLNVGGSATTLNLGATTGTTTIRNATTTVTGNAIVSATTASTSSTIGALTVLGGVGFSKNVYVGTGATINSTQSTENFIVKGVNATSLIIADSNTGTVIIGGSNATPVAGTTLKVNSTSAMMPPIGTIAQRPGSSGNVDVAGMFRYNSTSNSLEYYDSTAWISAGPAFTIVTDRQFVGNVVGGFGNVNGTNDVFTIQQASTTSSTLVSVNGLTKLPATDYNVSGTTLTFVTPPVVGSVIDVRCITATTTVTSLSSGSGLNIVLVDTTGVHLQTGTVIPVDHILIDPNGIMSYENNTKNSYNPTATTVGTSPIVIDTFAKATYRSAKYNVTTTNSGVTEFETTEVLVVHNGTTAYKTQYATLYTGAASLGNVTVAVNGANVELSYTGVAASNTVKVSVSYIRA